MGAYAVNGSSFDLFLLLALGVLGFAMRRFAIPVLPLIVGVILGPRVELQGRRAMQLSSGEARGLVGSVDVSGQFHLSVIAVCVYLVILIVLLWPPLFALLRRLMPAKAEAAVEHLSEEMHQDLDLPDHREHNPSTDGDLNHEKTRTREKS